MLEQMTFSRPLGQHPRGMWKECRKYWGLHQEKRRGQQLLAEKRLRDLAFLLLEKTKAVLEKAMAPHSSTLAWKIPWTEEPGRLQSMRSPRIRHD